MHVGLVAHKCVRFPREERLGVMQQPGPHGRLEVLEGLVAGIGTDEQLGCGRGAAAGEALIHYGLVLGAVRQKGQ